MIDRVGNAHSWGTMSDRTPATDLIEDLLSGTQLTPTTPPPPKDPPRGGSPSSMTLRLVPSPDSSTEGS